MIDRCVGLIQISAALPLNMLDEGTIYNTATDTFLFHVIVPLVLKYAQPLQTLKVLLPQFTEE